MSNNRNLMEAILAKIKSLILMMEPGEVDELNRLVNMACEVSNQLVRIENGECINNVSDYDDESDDEDNEETEEIEEE